MTEQEQIEERLRRAIEAYHVAALLYAAVKLRLPERMGARNWAARKLAKALGLSAPHLARFLRGLCMLGLCEERADGSFALTEAGQSLASGATLAQKVQIVVEQYWQPWANLVSTLQTGRPAFEHVFGMGAFDWRREHTEQGALFDSYLTKETAGQLGSIIEALDFSGVETVAILPARPCGMAFEKARIRELSKPFLPLLEVVKRVEVVPEDLRDAIPVKADLYLLIGVLQQYNDEDAHAILRNCRAAMPEGARLAIVERLLPERATDNPAAIMLDLHMMTITGGRARTLAQFEALLSAAGLAPSEVTPTRSGLSIVEAVST